MNTDKKFFGALLIPARVALSRAGEFAGPQSSVGHALGWKLAQTLICAAFALMATSAVADNYSVTELSFIPTAVNTSGAVWATVMLRAGAQFTPFSIRTAKPLTWARCQAAILAK